MSTIKPEESITALLWNKVASARAGDPKDAIAAAMLIHKFPLVARSTGLNSEYQFFLSFGMQSKDPEVLVAAGEALLEGKRLAPNFLHGILYFAKANKLSPFMGAFMIGRLEVFKDRLIARKMLQKGAEAGHIPSFFLLARLRYRNIKKYLSIFALPSLVFISIKYGWLLTVELKNRENLYMRFWRYKDAGLARQKELAKAMPVDRAYPFEDIEEALSD